MFFFSFGGGGCRIGLFWLSFWIFWYEIDSMEFFQTSTWEIVNTRFTPGQSWNTCSSIAFRHIWPWGHQRLITPCRFLWTNGQHPKIQDAPWWDLSGWCSESTGKPSVAALSDDEKSYLKEWWFNKATCVHKKGGWISNLHSGCVSFLKAMSI